MDEINIINYHLYLKASIISPTEIETSQRCSGTVVKTCMEASKKC